MFVCIFFKTFAKVTGEGFLYRTSLVNCKLLTMAQIV